MSMKTVAIPNLDVRVWTRESEFPQGHFLLSLTQPKITRQRTFEISDIGYDLIKDEIEMVDCDEYTTDVGIYINNVDDIEDFVNL